MADLAITAEAGTATSLAQAHIAADAYATSHPLLRTAPPEQQPQYQLAAYVTTAITVIVMIVVCLLRSRLERSLQVSNAMRSTPRQMQRGRRDCTRELSTR
jgi:hypothetical protein